MWPFKSKIEEVKEEEKLIMVQVLGDKTIQKINVGKTTIRINFLDGRKFDKILYGGAYWPENLIREHTFEDGRWKNATIPQVVVSTSKNEASLSMSCLRADIEGTFCDFPSPDTTKVICGNPISAEIKKTEDHFIEVEVQSLKNVLLPMKGPSTTKPSRRIRPSRYS